MKKTIWLSLFTGTLIFLIYLSSIYLVEAENSYQQLEQKKEELKIQFPFEIEQNKENQTEENLASSIPFQEEKEPSSSEQVMPLGAIPISSEVTVGEKVIAQASEKAGLISMEFENANLKDVLKIFCQQSGLNFVTAEGVELKPITLYLSNVTVTDALNSIIKANGLTYEQAEGSDVFIVKESGEAEIKLETRVFKLKNALAYDLEVKFSNTSSCKSDSVSHDTKGIRKTIEQLLTQHGKLSIDERTNSIIITDIPSQFPTIEQAIADLDNILPQIFIEAKIVEIESDDLDLLGLRWNSLGAYTVGITNPVRTYTSTRSGSQEREDVYSIDTSDSTQLDRTDTINYNPFTGTALDGTRRDITKIDDDLINLRNLEDTFTRTLSKTDLRSAVLTADDFTVTLSMLLTDESTNVLSSPSIVTEHAKQAKITVGDKYPIANFSYNSETGTYEVTDFEYIDIGIVLRVIPFASTIEDTVTLELYPEVSSISGFATFGGAAGAAIPIIATREAITKVVIKNGSTLAIGGLIKTRDKDIETKVPVLGDIPVLGRMFKHKSTSRQKLNTIIFITPRILTHTQLPLKTEQRVTLPQIVEVPDLANTPPITINLPKEKPQKVVQKKPEKKKEKKKIEPIAKKNNTQYQFTHR